MKKSLIITAGIFTLLLNANAQNISKAQIIKGEEPLQVKYIETQGDYLVFSVEVKAEGANRPVLSIDDVVEGELYSNIIGGRSKVQTMKIEKRENQVLDFKLVSGKSVYVKTFTTYAGVIEQAKGSEKSIAGL